MPMERSELSEAQCLAQLGVFQFLPIEIRLMVWDYLFAEYHSRQHSQSPTVSTLSILRCSRYLHYETSQHLYRSLHLKVLLTCSLFDNYLTYFSVYSKSLPKTTWKVDDRAVFQNILQNFPFHLMQKPELIVCIPSPIYGQDAQLINLWRRINELVGILEDSSQTPYVKVNLLGDWTCQNGSRAREALGWKRRPTPGCDYAILPFTRLSRCMWSYTIPSELHAIISKKRYRGSLLYPLRRFGHRNVQNLNYPSRNETELERFRLHHRLRINRSLDHITGKDARLLQKDRTQHWFKPGNGWESEYQKQLLNDLTTNFQVVVGCDPGLESTRERFRKVIYSHHMAHGLANRTIFSSFEERRPTIFKTWDPKVFSIWPFSILPVNGPFAIEPSESIKNIIIDQYINETTALGDFWNILEWWGSSAYSFMYEPLIGPKVCLECQSLNASCLWCQKYDVNKLCPNCGSRSSSRADI